MKRILMLAFTALMVTVYAEGQLLIDQSDPLNISTGRHIKIKLKSGEFTVQILGTVSYDQVSQNATVTVHIIVTGPSGTITFPVTYSGTIYNPRRLRKNMYEEKDIVESDRPFVNAVMQRLYLPLDGNIKRVQFENFR